MELQMALDILRNRGWTRRDWENEEGVCVMEALYKSFSHHGTDEARRFFLIGVLRECTNNDNGLLSWNDELTRTVDDVESLFRDAMNRVLDLTQGDEPGTF